MDQRTVPAEGIEPPMSSDECFTGTLPHLWLTGFRRWMGSDTHLHPNQVRTGMGFRRWVGFWDAHLLGPGENRTRADIG